MVNSQETKRLLVCLALFEQSIGGLVYRWMTTSEYLLLYVFVFSQHYESVGFDVFVAQHYESP